VEEPGAGGTDAAAHCVGLVRIKIVHDDDVAVPQGRDLAFMLFDQRCAGKKDGGKSQKQAAHHRAIRVHDQAGDHGCQTAEADAIRYSSSSGLPLTPLGQDAPCRNRVPIA